MSIYEAFRLLLSLLLLLLLLNCLFACSPKNIMCARQKIPYIYAYEINERIRNSNLHMNSYLVVHSYCILPCSNEVINFLLRNNNSMATAADVIVVVILRYSCFYAVHIFTFSYNSQIQSKTNVRVKHMYCMQYN